MTTAFLLAMMLFQAPDFQIYRKQVEPIFLKLRDANGPGGSCFGCHTTVVSRFRLQHPSSALTWTEQQSRLNYEAVLKLIAPGDPTKSRLLMHPLASEAGGSPIHYGGKHWRSQDDPEWQALAAWVRTGKPPATPPPPPPALDFETFKTRVQPILLTKRPGHARCSVCHSQATNYRLQPLPPGRTMWTEEESRMNYTATLRVVVPGEPEVSRLLMMPLEEKAGGDVFHPGGKHWPSRDDPEWQTLAAWVRGK